MRASVFVGISLDGFIAREDGGIDWLVSDEGAGEEAYGYREFFASVDALVMGRNTFDLVRTFPSWPYGEKPVIVLTSRALDIPAEIGVPVETMSGSPRDVVNRLSARGMQHLYVDGGKTVQAFLRDGLIQRITITRLPVLIGSGIPLFGPLPHDVRLRHLATRAFDNGMVQSEYEVVSEA